MKKQISRREMLKMMGMTMAAATLAACAPQATAVLPTETASGPTAIPPTKAPPTAVPPTATAVPPTPTPAPTMMGNMDFTWMIPTQQTLAVHESNPMQELMKKFNVKIDFNESLPDDTYTEKKKLALASQDLPDILSWITMDEANQYGPQGAFLEITPLLDQMPNLKKLIDGDQVAKYNAYTADNKIWRIPDYNVVTSPIYDFSYVKAEFDAVGATTLETFDQVYDALTKLKAKYPNSYPLTMRGKETGSWMMRNMFEMGFTEGKNGAIQRNIDNIIAFDNDQKQWIFGDAAPGFSDAISFLNKLYQEKLLDPEYLTLTMNDMLGRFKDKKAFMTTDFVGGLSGIPSIQEPYGLYPLPTPYATGKKQILGFTAGNIGNRGTALSATLKGERLTRVLQMFDWIYSPEFYDLFYWNPAVAAKDANGKWAYTNEGMYNSDPKVTEVYMPWSVMANFQVNYTTTYKAGGIYADYITKVLVADSNKAKYLSVPILPFTQDQTTQLTTWGAATDDYFTSRIDAYVMNKRPLTEWDGFIQDLLSKGDQQAVDLYNTVYKQYFKA